MTLSEKTYKVCKRCIFPNEFESIFQIKKLFNGRLKLFHARRRGEAAILTLAECNDRLSGKRVNENVAGKLDNEVHMMCKLR